MNKKTLIAILAVLIGVFLFGFGLMWFKGSSRFLSPAGLGTRKAGGVFAENGFIAKHQTSFITLAPDF